MIAGSVLMIASHTLGLSAVGVVVLGIGMGITNAAVFKLVPLYVNQAVGGASGWIGGLGAFGGFVIPPILGAVVRSQGLDGYATGFATFIILAILALGMAYLLRRSHIVHQEPSPARVT